MSSLKAIYKRELNSYFSTPIAYVFIVIFIFLTGIFTFKLANFYENGQYPNPHYSLRLVKAGILSAN